MEENNKMPLWKLILVTVILLAFPLLVGGIFSYINGNTTFLEVALIVWGVFFWIAISIRSRARDSMNYKKNKTVFEDKSTKDYKEYKKVQLYLFLFGLGCCLLSVIVFLIGNVL